MKEIGELGHLLMCVFLYNFATFMVLPAITDVTMEALCPGREQCSRAIYLSGFQQTITGIGTLILTPFLGNLSDEYGRKTILTLPMTIAVVPLAILACGRSTYLFYAYYVTSTLAGMISKGCVPCLTLSYVADKVGELRRAAAFGVVSGVSAAGFVVGTLVARLIPTSVTFQVSTTFALVALVYMRVFLVESVGFEAEIDDVSRPIVSSTGEVELEKRTSSSRKSLSPMDMVQLVRSSVTFSQAAVIAFLASFGDSGLQDSLLYFLKAQFHFSKDQFANLLLIVGISGAFSQLLLMPVIISAIGEERLLSLALLATCAHIFLYSIAWASWVVYLAGGFIVASVFVHPCLRSIVSKKVGPHEQGVAQGCISGVASFANILAPLVISPLTALFLSENAPFHFPGFSLMFTGFIAMAAFVQSLAMTRVDSPILIKKLNGPLLA